MRTSWASGGVIEAERLWWRHVLGLSTGPGGAAQPVPSLVVGGSLPRAELRGRAVILGLLG